MKILSKKVLWEGDFLKVTGKYFHNEKGEENIWECIDRANSRGVVCVFGLTKGNEVILVNEYRYPIESHMVQIPAGLVDQNGENAEEAARREFMEETGYKAGELIQIFKCPLSQGMTSEEMIYYFAPNVLPLKEKLPSSDDYDEENIEVIKVPLNELADFCLKKHEDFKVDIRILGALKILESKKLIKI